MTIPEVLNLGEYYYPPEHLLGGLERVITFTENTKKRGIPNGSVFVYSRREYIPEILASDIGCGITAVITEKIKFDEKSRLRILEIVDKIGRHIGQGNHFLDFTTRHPSFHKRKNFSNMIFLHSDFNNENYTPSNFSEAKYLEKQAREERRSYLEQLSRLLGISSYFYKDWTHNSVNIEDGLMVYRKGAIDLRETDGVGALALDPIDGIYLYAAEFREYNSSMQHAVGRIGSKGELLDRMQKINSGKVRGYTINGSDVTRELRGIKNKVYNSIDGYIDRFGLSESSIGFCVPELVVTTKKSSCY